MSGNKVTFGVTSKGKPLVIHTHMNLLNIENMQVEIFIGVASFTRVANVKKVNDQKR